jgi:hypothetical protein
MLRNLIILGACAILEFDAIAKLLNEAPGAALVLFVGAGRLASQVRWRDWRLPISSKFWNSALRFQRSW